MQTLQIHLRTALKMSLKNGKAKIINPQKNTQDKSVTFRYLASNALILNFPNISGLRRQALGVIIIYLKFSKKRNDPTKIKD